MDLQEEIDLLIEEIFERTSLDKTKLQYDIRDLVVDFARFKVREALVAASEQVELKEVGRLSAYGKCQIINYKGDAYELDKDSILNAYPLDNIK